VRIATGSDDSESHLVFADGFLVAILVQLGEQHEDEAGMWFLEAGFGPVDRINPPTFINLDEAQMWIELRLKGAADGLY
jgi:hypothetical protein